MAQNCSMRTIGCLATRHEYYCYVNNIAILTLKSQKSSTLITETMFDTLY